MGRVNAEKIQKLHELIDSLPEEERGKCALCNETLTHIVKQAEVKTGAGTATVTRVIAEKHNETAAPHDQVSGKKLLDRVRYKEGKDKIGNSENKPTDDTEDQKADTKKDKSDQRSYIGASEQATAAKPVRSPQKTLKFSDLLEKIKEITEQYVTHLHSFGVLRDSESLKNDQPHKDIENLMSWLITEAKEVGLRPRGVPGPEQPREDNLEEITRSAHDFKMLVIGSIENRPQDDPAITDALSEIINRCFTAIGNDDLHQRNDDSFGIAVLPNPETPWGAAAIILNYLNAHFKNDCDLTANIDNDDLVILECGFDDLKPYSHKVLDEKYKDHRL